MPKWSTSVPADPRGPAFPIQRTPAFKALEAIATSDDIIGTYTHFYKGRTMPCENPKCEACNHGVPYRWHAYLSAYDRKTSLHFIFECTAQAAEAFTDYRKCHGRLRGCEFKASRMNAKTNGRIVIRTRPADLTQTNLPKPPDVIKCLAILWNLPSNDVTADRRNPEKDMPHVRPPITP